MQAIDKDVARERAALPSESYRYRVAIALSTAAVCLLLVNYLKYSSVFESALQWFYALSEGDWRQQYRLLRNDTFYPLYSHLWWGAWQVIAFVLIPMLVIKFIFREQVRDYGLRIGKLAEHKWWYVLLGAPIICFALLASFRDDFTSHYPFYALAHRSWADLLAWQLIYSIQFFCIEFFFRGFLLQSCRVPLGFNAIFVMSLPYLMLHFTKPWLEASGAILFGLFLGILAMRSRTIWGGVMVHITIALTMDLAAMAQITGFPSVWWPG
ncbi:MAG: CPBP family intramembrane metalloprotease [Gammaproteobacteria bacterium]|nr:CPBP family intramembrane metalloprotease [Gammaproteobacteria bacterium]